MSHALRRTKILATLGPATDAPGVLDGLVRAGVNVVRLNFSHGTPEHHAARVAAVRSATTWGRVGFVGEGGTVTLDVSRDLLRRQLTLIASWTFSATGQAECARFIADRRIPLGRLLTHRFRLEQADEAYRLFDTQTTGKGVFVF